MSRAVEALLAGAERMALGDGRFLRLLSAQETLEARREGEALARTGREKALCSNAALLARALEGPEGPLFSHAQAALEGMTAREIGVLSAQWAAFDRAQNPAPENPEQVEEWKRELAGHTGERLRWRVLRAFGVLPHEERARSMKERDVLRCALHLLLDQEEELERLCPACRREALEGRCPVCGAPVGAAEAGENAAFDRERYEALSRGVRP